MAIGVPVKPTLIVTGQIISVTPRRGYDRETNRRTDEVIGYEVTVQQDNGAQVKVRFSNDDAQVFVGNFFAGLVDIQESREYGAFAVFVRNLLADDLDRINSALNAEKVGAGK